MTEVVLNRPLAFNALNLNMIREIRKQVSDWNNSTNQLVYFNGEGTKAFCAGGDIKSLYNYKLNP
jgi:enoyl-CoA hydratase/carnithine racemase